MYAESSYANELTMTTYPIVTQSVVSVLTTSLSFPFHPIKQTYIGSILVSVNPYKLLNIYGTDMVLQYEGHSLNDNPP